MSTTLPPIACRSPRADEWIRVKPGPESRFNTPVLCDPSSGDLYLVVGHLWHRLANRLAMVCPRLCANHAGEMFVWAVPIPTPGRTPSWRHAAGMLAELAEMRWCRIVDDETVKQYVVSTLPATEAPSTPVWPDGDFLDVLHAAFRGRLITSEDHPLVPLWN